MSELYRKAPNILIQKVIDDECVVVNTDSGNVHQLNPVATCIWHNLEDDKDIASLAVILVEEYGVSKKTALRDVKHFVKELGNLGLLRKVD